MNYNYREVLQRFGVPIVLLLSILTVQLFNLQTALLSWSNLKTVASQSTVIVLVALGLSAIMISGEIDLSIGGTLGVIGAVFAMLLQKEVGLFWAVIGTLAVSGLFGLFTGIFISKFKFSSFLFSVSLMFVAMGIHRAFTDGQTIWIDDKSILAISKIEVIGIPLLTIAVLLLFLVYWVFVNRTKLGFNLRVVGENETAAKEVGVNTSKTKIIAFVTASIFYGIASVIEPMRVSGAIIYSGQVLLMPAMAACFLGSTMFVPGRVNPLGTLVSAIFLSLIVNFLTLLGVQYYYVSIVQGLMLLFAVSLSNIKDRSIRQLKL